MRRLSRRHLALAVLLGGLALAAQARQAYSGVKSIVAEAVDGALSRRVDDAGQVATIVEEVNTQRRKRWTSWEGPLQRCAVRLHFHGARGRIGTLVVQGDELIEPGVSRTSGLKRELGSFDAPATRRLAARIRKPADCKR